MDFRFRLIARHSRGYELLDALLEVETEFLAELCVDAPPRGGEAEGASAVARLVTHRAPAPRAAITMPTASVYRAHRDNSAVSCFRPCGVRR